MGFVRQLRAELRSECREALLAGWVERPPSAIDGEGYAAVRGLVIAARLARLSFKMPPLRGRFHEAQLQRFIEKTVKPWQRRQMARLATWDQQIAVLAPDSHGKVVALLARTEAARRLAGAPRAAPFPLFLKKDYARRNQYFVAIDQASQPVVSDFEEHQETALAILERRGVIGQESSRSVLSSRGTGRRDPVHAQLALPHLSAPAEDGPAPVWLARRLASDTVERILLPEQLTEIPALTALAARGLPGSVRAYFGQHPPDPEQAYLLGHARVRLGLLYQSKEQFLRARLLLDRGAPHPDAGFLMALVAVLERFDPSQSSQPTDVFAPLLRLAQNAQVRERVDTPQDLGLALATLDLAYLEIASAEGDSAQSQRAFAHLTAATKALAGSEYAPCVESDQLKFIPFRPLDHPNGEPECQPMESWLPWQGR